MALAITQQVADGIQTDFPFSFLIAADTLVDVYVNPVGQAASEVNDLVSPATYTLVLNAPVDGFSDGTVEFGVAPLDQEVVTITAQASGAIDIDFEATEQLVPANLNKAFAEHTTPIDYSFGLFEDRTTRYNVNVKENLIDYDTLLPPLPAKDFWRRNDIATGSPGAAIIAQDFDDFVDDVQDALANNLTILNLILPVGAVFIAGAPGLSPPLDGVSGVTWTRINEGEVMITGTVANAGSITSTAPDPGTSDAFRFAVWTRLT